jgi:nucleotide-binding universal stress UspA family protein
MTARILAPTDGSPLSMKAVREAAHWADKSGAELQVLSVKRPYAFGPLSEVRPSLRHNYDEEEDRQAQARVSSAIAEANQAGLTRVQGAITESDQVWRAILDEAEAKDCELIVMASHGHHGLGALLLGSETQKVLAHGKRPVMVVR